VKSGTEQVESVAGAANGAANSADVPPQTI
jgi:hypothetical protein